MTEDELPPAARLVRDFLNTSEPQTGKETYDSAEALRAWLVQQDLLADPTVAVQPDDFATARSVREGLRNALLSHAGHEPDPGRVAALNETLAQVPVRVVFHPGGYHLVSIRTDPVGQAFGLLLDAIRQTTADGTWPRLKVCARDTCRWAFYDASRNQVRRWCSMAGCGNYVKMRRAADARKSRAQSTAQT